ncbi:MAG: hypothetical protein B6D62_04680 [Candidatus Cloacimonas sp. 4484_275]|nr:MAG: hypothetical protein B6D62_04680 [Candidatus Cloacimonas sp. 4484_275]
MKQSANKKTRILVLDGDHKNALAIVRHLGKTGNYRIEVASYGKASICFFSKYTAKKYIISHPLKNAAAYLRELLETLKKNKIDVLLPVSHISYKICAQNVDEIRKYTHITLPEFEKIELASSKIATYRLAEKLKIPYPSFFEIEKIEDVRKIDIDFPCVIKAPFEAGKNIVEYANDKTELLKKYEKICRENSFESKLPIIQKYVEGQGFGFFAYYENGKCKSYFMHKRIREYPVTGGASVCAESFYDEKLMVFGKKILDYLKWNGVAMVEFKKDNRTGIYNLMEINAKFWGSLELALVSGVDFPQMLIDKALNKKVSYPEHYAMKRFQWILNGELFHGLEKPKNIPAIIKDLFVSKKDISFSDFKPNFYQLFYIPVFYLKKWFK